jgi:hypothetical protein
MRGLIVNRGCLLVAVSGCCHNPPRIVSFDLQPPQTCAGQPVTLTWEVVGPARLAMIAGPKDREPDANAILAKEQDVKSKDSIKPTVSESTWFVLRAVDANQAKVQWQGKQPVDVPIGKRPKVVTTDCDAQGKCTGKFTLDPPPGLLQVVHLEDPHMTIAGTQTPATVHVTHGSLDTKLEPGKGQDVSEAAEGDWTLDVSLSADQARGPPPKLDFTATFSCR